MAGLALYDFLNGEGKRVHVLANNEDQATILLDTAKTMVSRLADNLKNDAIERFKSLERDDADCYMNALPALERSLDGLNPSCWVADEAAEFKGRFLTKLLTTGAKRKESTGSCPHGLAKNITRNPDRTGSRRPRTTLTWMI
jgi:phage terminase large subunit-like protein